VIDNERDSERKGGELIKRLTRRQRRPRPPGKKEAIANRNLIEIIIPPAPQSTVHKLDTCGGIFLNIEKRVGHEEAECEKCKDLTIKLPERKCLYRRR